MTSVTWPSVDFVAVSRGEPRVGRHLQALDACDYFVPKRRGEVDAVGLEQLDGRVVVPLRLDPLDLGEQPANTLLKRLDVDHHEERLSVALADVDRLRVRHQPPDDHLPVAHVVFFDLRALADAAELDERVARIALVLGLHDLGVVLRVDEASCASFGSGRK